MRKFVTEYIAKSPKCERYKTTDQKTAGLIQTPVHGQVFDVLSNVLFGTLPLHSFGTQ